MLTLFLSPCLQEQLYRSSPFIEPVKISEFFLKSFARSLTHLLTHSAIVCKLSCCVPMTRTRRSRVEVMLIEIVH